MLIGSTGSVSVGFTIFGNNNQASEEDNPLSCSDVLSDSGGRTFFQIGFSNSPPPAFPTFYLGNFQWPQLRPSGTNDSTNPCSSSIQWVDPQLDPNGLTFSQFLTVPTIKVLNNVVVNSGANTPVSTSPPFSPASSSGTRIVSFFQTVCTPPLNHFSVFTLYCC